MDQPERNIIVIGASQGGVSALQKLVSSWSRNLPAAVFVVLHIPPYHETRLHWILSESGQLPARLAEHGAPFASGSVYVAIPNHHLLVGKDRMAITFGPRENRARPSIDALFRSAAAHHTTRVVAVLLTGYLSDGVNGLSAVNRCGGVTLVQDPSEAEAPELPQTAIRRVAVDHILPLEGIAATISRLAGQTASAPVQVPEDIMEDVHASEYEVPKMDHMRRIGDLTPYTCPECGGVLWKTKNEALQRFVCHTGHSFSHKAFLDGQAESIENSLWSAIRFMQERIDILTRMAESSRESAKPDRATAYEQKAQEMKTHALNIRRFIVSGALNSVLRGEGEEETPIG